MSNPFDFDEVDASREFEKSIIFGISPHDSSYGTAHDFMKKSLAAANMLSDVDEEDGIQVTALAKAGSVSFTKHSEPDGLKPIENISLSARTRSKDGSFSDHIKDWNASERSYGRPQFSLDEVVHEKPQISATDFQKLQEELRKAKQTIEVMKGEKWSSIPVRDTIQRMVMGKPFALEGYKALSAKQELLDAAVKSRDGNAITTVIIFAEKTLKPSLFYREIQKRKPVLKHYIQYLRKHDEWEKLEELYKKMLLLEEAAYLRYENINAVKSIKARLELLNKWIQDYGMKQEVADLSSHIRDEIVLLKTQEELETEDKVRAVAQSDVVMKYHPRTSIENKSLITTVFYCALYHYEKSSKHHPESFKKNFKDTIVFLAGSDCLNYMLSEKQYEWAVIPPRANLHRWADIQELLTSSGWFKKGEVSNMGFDQVVAVMFRAKATEEILTKYLNLISNTELRLKCASKYGMHDVAIDTIVYLRDRRRMEEYRLTVGSLSKYRQKINDLLNNSTIKWK